MENKCNTNDVVSLKTDRLILRSMTPKDIDDFYEIFSSDAVGKFIYKMTKKDVENYFSHKITQCLNPYNMAVILKDNNKMIGTVEIKLKEGYGYLSYVFNEKYWNKGYCTESCKCLINYFFKNEQINYIRADCNKNNNASINILTNKLKMKLIDKSTDCMIDCVANKKVEFLYFELERKSILD